MQNWNDQIRQQLNDLPGFPPTPTGSPPGTPATPLEWILGDWIQECRVRPSAATFASLPVTGNFVGDIRASIADQAWYMWDGAAWQPMGGGGGAVNSVTASAPLASSGGANPDISLTGIVAPANGGTGIALPGALNNVLTSDGAGGWTSSAPSGGTVTGVTATGPLASSGGATPDISLTGIVAPANGGTGIALPGALNNVLTSDGAGGWTSSAPSGGATAQGGANAVQYANATTPADFDGNANFVYDEATGRLGIGTASPSTTLHVNSGAVNGTAIATLQNTAGDFQVFRVDANPEGSVTGSIGDIADDSTNGVVYVKTSGSATNTGWSPLANLGTKVYIVVEGGQYATIQAAIDATPTGTNIVPAYSVILVGPKANTGGGASGSWGPAVLAANKSLMITGLGGAQTAKDIRIDSLTFDSSAAGLNANLNENYISGLYITSSSVTSVVTFGGTGAIRLRLNNCYVVNTGAGDAVTNTNSNVNGSLYLDTCIVSAESTTGIAVRSSGTYTAIRNRTEISTATGGTNLSTGRSLSASAGVVEIYDCFVGGASVPRPVVELTGTAFLASGYTTINNTSNDANARCVFVNSATATFASGDASLALGSSVAVVGQVVSGTGTFVFGNITFSYSPLLTVATQTPALRTGGWFTTDIKEGISLTSPGNPLFNLNSSGRITRYNDAAPTNGQVLIGDTAAGYFKSASLTAGSGVTITPGAGSVTIAATGVGGSGVAAQLAYFTSASAIGSETGVGADALTWDATNNRLGVGTNTPTTAVDVATGQVAIPDGTAAAPALAFRDDLNTGLYSPTNDIVGVAVNGTEVARFQQGTGNTPVMLMGTSTIYGAITVDSSDPSGITGVVMLGHVAAGTTLQESYRGGQFAGVRSRGTKAAPTAVASGDGLVNMLGAGYYTNHPTPPAYNYGALITVKAEQAYTATASGGRVEIHTTLNGTDGFTTLGNTATERMRIANDGRVSVGQSGGSIIPAAAGSILTLAGGLTQSAGAVSLTGNAASSLTTSAGDLTLTGGVNLQLAAGFGSAVVVNEFASNVDFRVESQANTNMLLVDASQSTVSVGTTGNTHTFNIGTGALSNFAVASGGRIHTYDGVAPTNGQVLIGDTALGNFAKAALTAGTGISVTNGAGSITIAATGTTASAFVDVPGYVAQQALNAGDLVRFVDDAGTPKVQKADATNTDVRLNPVGFAVAAALVGGAVTVRVAGVADVPAARFDVAPAAADVGKRVFVSTTSGQITLTAPSASGDVLQRAGVLVDGGANPKVLVQVGDPTLL